VQVDEVASDDPVLAGPGRGVDHRRGDAPIDGGTANSTPQKGSPPVNPGYASTRV